jgi:hypothetical protein
VVTNLSIQLSVMLLKAHGFYESALRNDDWVRYATMGSRQTTTNTCSVFPFIVGPNATSFYILLKRLVEGGNQLPAYEPVGSYSSAVPRATKPETILVPRSKNIAIDRASSDLWVITRLHDLGQSCMASFARGLTGVGLIMSSRCYDQTRGPFPSRSSVSKRNCCWYAGRSCPGQPAKHNQWFAWCSNLSRRRSISVIRLC